MKRVLVESPLAGDVERNTRYARAAVLDCLRRGEAPYASHLFFPQVLDDLKPEERQLGIEAGLLWGEAAEVTVVYIDLGVSSGMVHGIDRARELGRPVEYRRLPAWDKAAQPTAWQDRLRELFAAAFSPDSCSECHDTGTRPAGGGSR